MASEENPRRQYDQLISTLPSCQGWVTPLLLYHGCWYPQFHLAGGLSFLHHFKPRDPDIFIISQPKSGTTWLKALLFATVNRKDRSPFADDHPLLRVNPHDLVPLVDEVFGCGRDSELDHLDPPRLFSSHLPVQSLPESMLRSDCKIIYVCRDPKDNLVSKWHFSNNLLPQGKIPMPFDEAYELYCNGMSPYGPVWEHQLGYWKESLDRPEKVLFLKYEDMLEDPMENLKKIAGFVGYPFSQAEEVGVAEAIVEMCSFEKLSGLDVNRTGDHQVEEIVFKNSAYFRKGKAGDWKNYLTPEMARRLDEITETKLHGSGLSFSTHGKS